MKKDKFHRHGYFFLCVHRSDYLLGLLHGGKWAIIQYSTEPEYVLGARIFF